MKHFWLIPIFLSVSMPTSAQNKKAGSTPAKPTAAAQTAQKVKPGAATTSATVEKAPSSTAVNPEAKRYYDDATAAMQESWELGDTGNARALALLQQCIAKDPSFTDAYLKQGQIYEDQLEWQKAIDTYRAAAQSSIDKEVGFVHLGRIYAAINREVEAKRILESIVNRNPYNVAAKNILASMKRRTGDLVGAEKMLGSALSLAAEDADTFKELALLQFQSRRLNEARLSLLKGMKIKEGDAGLHNLLGMIQLQEGDTAKAVESFKRAIEFDERFVPARLNLSSIYLANGYFKIAQDELIYAMKAQPRNPKILIALGAAYRGTGDYKRAEEHYKKAAALDSGNPLATYDLAVLQYKYLGNSEAAAGNFKSFDAGKVDPRVLKITAPQADNYLLRIQLAGQKQSEVQAWHAKTEAALNAYQKSAESRRGGEAKLVENLQELQSGWKSRVDAERRMAELDKLIYNKREARQKSDNSLIDSTQGMTKQRGDLTKLDDRMVAAAQAVTNQSQSREQVNQQFTAQMKNQRDFQNDLVGTGDRVIRLERSLDKQATSSPLRDRLDQLKQVFKQQENLDKRYDSVVKKISDNNRRLIALESGMRGDQANVQKAELERRGADGSFSTTAMELYKIDGSLNELYKEMAAIEESRAKLEAAASEGQKVINEIRKRRFTGEQEFPKMLQEAQKLEANLLNLDRKREAIGTPLDSLEEQRKNQLFALNDFGLQMFEFKTEVIDADAKFQKAAAEINGQINKISQLEGQRGQIELKIAELLQQRQTTRDGISKLLDSQKRLDRSFEEGSERRRNFDAQLLQAVNERRRLVEEERQILKQMQDLSQSAAQTVDNSRPSNRSASGSDIKTSQASEFVAQNEKFAGLIKQYADIDGERQRLIAAATKLEKGLAEALDGLISVQKQRYTAQGGWQQGREQRVRLESERSTHDQEMAEARKQRQGLEESRRGSEAKNRQVLESWSQGLQSRAQQQQREMLQLDDLIEVDKQRQQAVVSDLLPRFQAAASPAAKPAASRPAKKMQGKGE